MKYYHKVITEDMDRRTRPWDTVYLFDVIKVHLAKKKHHRAYFQHGNVPYIKG